MTPHHRRSRAGAAVAGAVVLAVAAGAASASDRIWYPARGEGDGGAAIYGVPGTDDRLLGLSCDPARPDAVEVSPELFLAEAPAGSTDEVLFNVDGASFERAARYRHRAESAGFRAVVTVNRRDPLVRALERGRHASFTHQPPQPGEVPVEVPLHRASEVIGTMLEAC